MRILNYERCGVSGKKAIDFSYDTPCTKAEYFGMFHGQVTVDLIWAINERIVINVIFYFVSVQTASISMISDLSFLSHKVM